METEELNMKKRKKIGLIGVAGKDFFGVSTQYMKYAQLFGDVFILTPESPIMDLDLLILQGGADLNPDTYGQIPAYGLSFSNPYLEYFDKYKLGTYIEKGTAIFGICRGLQVLNVFFGGTLDQHINGHPMSEKTRGQLVHKVILEGARFKREESFEVNSLHHQKIKELGEGLITLAKAKDGTIEAIAHKTLPICAVQYHPEEIYDSYSINLVKSLLE